MRVRLIALVTVAFIGFVVCAASQDTNVVQQRLENFASWLRDVDVKVNKLGVSHLSPNGRGITATADIQAGEFLVSVPASTAIVANDQLMKEYNQLLSDGTLDKTEALALYILQQRADKASKWYPYLNALPLNFDLPLFWQENDLDELKGSLAYDLTIARKQRILRFYENVVKSLIQRHPGKFPAEVFSLNEVAWAYAIVMSRAYQLGNDQLVMVPMLDMFNHDNVATRFGVNSETGEFHIVAQEPVANGKEIFVSFGNKTNAELLSTYGFVLLDNKHDGYAIRVSLDDADPFFDVRARMLSSLGLPREAMFLLKNGEISQELLAVLRVHSLTPSEFDRYPQVLTSPISLSNELKAYRRLGLMCADALAQYTTSLEDDETSLKSSTELSAHKRAALVLRASEKAVLRDVQHRVADMWLTFLRDGAQNLQ